MNFVELWAVLNGLLSLVTTAAASFVALRFAERLIPSERVGLALVASGSFMRIAPIIGFLEGVETPLDQWASTLMMGGILLFLFGRGFRLYRHERANKQQVALSQAYLAGRGKL